MSPRPASPRPHHGKVSVQTPRAGSIHCAKGSWAATGTSVSAGFPPRNCCRDLSGKVPVQVLGKATQVGM